MRRFAPITAAALLALVPGGACTLGVAFWCAANRGFSSVTTPIATPRWPAPAPAAWPPPDTSGTYGPCGFGAATIHARCTTTPPACSQFVQLVGWPSFSFYSASNTTTSPNHGSSVPDPAAEQPLVWVIPDRFTPDPYPRQFPLRVRWSGFLLDTALFALLWLLPCLAALRMRSMYRRIRGRCVRCGYRMESLAACPECGGPRTPDSRTGRPEREGTAREADGNDVR